MTKAIWEELATTKATLLQTIDSYTTEQFNVVPFEGSWTAGQTADHILRFASGGVSILNGDGQTTERNPEQNIVPLRDLFLNFEIKMNAPEFVCPAEAPHNKEVLHRALDQVFTKMAALSKHADLNLTFTDFEMPQFGKLTRLEWLLFILFHTQRHIHQLQNIHQRLIN